MSRAQVQDEGSWRALFFACAAVPFLALSLAALAITARPSGTDAADLGPAGLLTESIAIVLAIVAIWAGDETSRRGRAGRRLGMGIVIAAVGLRLAAGAILG